MKRTIAFMTLVLLMTAALSGTGCKSRDVKQMALSLGPVPVAPAVQATCQGVAESYSLSGTGCWGYYYDETTEADANGPFTDCGMDDYETNNTQKWYSVTLDSANYLSVSVWEDDEVGISLRRNCNPGDNPADIIDCDVNDNTYASVGAYVQPGTYYFVIGQLCCATGYEYEYQICVGDD